ncbi:alpha/beta hydrolase [Lentzea tibetensis]|uniref:Alpha/beta hydrolase n=1 Tax=Lentzea tibetensis TaxID=2591470 RepID=A0A563ESN6_9PSEU|nr:alpha/beta hydrolase [Lentzea tibetensis]TWP50663.1 alpha/beta hydrolase [Lentzea tibetensis]
MTATTTASRDGTPIAYWTTGRGPALVLVHGVTGDHTRWHAVLPLLEPHATVHTVDRRGRGGSGDTTDYALEQEAADIAAVVDAVAGDTGRQVDLLGHSYGAICALEASLLTNGVRRLVLYEPGIGVPKPGGFTDRMAELLAQNRRDEILTGLFELIEMPSEQQEIARSLPSWPGRVAAAHTVVRELRANDRYSFDAARFAELTTPTLLLAGGDSPPDETVSTEALAKALPNARVTTMAGQGHVAMLTAPRLFASEVLGFLRS